ncbi:DNA-binding SARP family transcriptional activator [Stackebrandtia albiflava]|uniref:DNA-binding SARP family transcriptional activator n=1 Tax=Stackebrandtia albiflava TaxID=406432 RepID=A0A562VCB3_9ACTN|nr:BTAD domain-containing putative transcriptional regulator [Stackebrandtia albiflava]TWJ15519.1 DNA-binding SARP family transcriptional activator [Stackebrandtia albiflava]
MDFRVLGNVEVSEASGAPVSLPGKRVRALLAVLLLDAGRTVPVSRIADALWEQPPITAVRQVQHCVSLLRKALQGSGTGLLTEASGYRLLTAPEDTVDVIVFEDLVARARRSMPDRPGEAVDLWRSALALWRGNALADVCHAELVHRAAYLDEQRVVATEECLAAQLELGRHREAIAELTSLTSGFPLRERPTELLIRALRACGRRIEALDVYQAFRGRLNEELGLDPGERLNRLHRELLRGDDTGGEVRTAAPVALPAMPAPAELPGDLASFTGRQPVLRELTKHVEDAGGTVAVVHGIAGCGKTTLAVRFAHSVADRFPDGALYVNLRAHGPSPALQPFAALSQLMRSLGVAPGLQPQDTDELAGRFRSTVAGRRLLILLDDAADAEQVLPLLPGTPGCLVLITSRAELPGLAGRTDALSVPLGPFEPWESVSLLRTFVDGGRLGDEATLRRVAGLCSGLPVALRLVGERLRRDRRLTTTVLATELAGPDRLDRLRLPGDPGIRSAFDASYRALPERLRSLWRILAVAPVETVNVHTAARLADWPEPQADAALERLATAHLLEVTDTGVYRFHVLLRMFAIERADVEDPVESREAAARRLLDWYVSRVDAAYQTLSPEFPPIRRPVERSRLFATKPAAMGWLHEESANLVECGRYAERRGLPHCWQLTVGMTNWWVSRGSRPDWVRSLGAVLAMAQRIGDREGQWRVNHGLGLAHYLAGNFVASRTHFRKAISLTQLLGRARDGLWSHSILAELELEHGRYADASHTLHRAIAMLPNNRRLPRLEATLHRNLGYLRLKTGRAAEALEPLRKANVLLSGISADVCRSYVELALGEAHQALGRPVLANRHLRQGLRLLENDHNRRLRGHAHLRLGAFLLEHGDPAEARTHLEVLLEQPELVNAEDVAEARKLLARSADPPG